MDMILTRVEMGEHGIFSILSDIDQTIEFQCAEHAYFVDGLWVPKVPFGIYECVRGKHKLDHMAESFVAFEIMKVPNHTGCLFHIGNLPQKDSIGCVLLGLLRQANAVISSEKAFDKFMELEAPVDSFSLLVTE